MHYLVASQKIAVSADDVRARIGLTSRAFDATLNAEIAFTAIGLESRLGVGFSRQVWAVQRFEHKPLGDFFGAVRFRKNLVSIGPAYRLACNPSDALGPYHDCTYGPDTRHVNALIAAVAAWALRRDDILDQIAREKCEDRVSGWRREDFDVLPTVEPAPVDFWNPLVLHEQRETLAEGML